MRFIRKTSYQQDINLIQHSGHVLWYGLLVLAVLSGPLWLDRFLLGEFSLVFIYAIAGFGLMILVGYTGLVSLGHAAFLAIGAYMHALSSESWRTVSHQYAVRYAFFRIDWRLGGDSSAPYDRHLSGCGYFGICRDR